MLLDHIVQQLKSKSTKKEPIIIGIDGLSGAGKTTISQQLLNELNAAGYHTLLLHIDDLIETREKRYETGYPEWYEYYKLQWNVSYLEKNLFLKMKENVDELILNFYEKETDQLTERKMNVAAIKVIVIEGVFLQRSEWRHYFDYVVYLDCPKEKRYERVLQRDTYIGNIHERRQKYERRYWKGEEHYLEVAKPLDNADFIITIG